MATYVFPKSFRQSSKAGSSYPAICFAHIDTARQYGDYIYFPMPQGLDIKDSLSYGTVELGQIGDIAVKTVEAMKRGESGVAAALNSAVDKYKSMNMGAVAAIIADKLGGDKAKNIVNFANKQLVNPNQNTVFQGAGIRSFSFKFKLVASSVDESDLIKSIVASFREKAYPSAGSTPTADFLLEFPGTWLISFLEGDRINPYLPELYECYLTSIGTTYNSSTNMWHEDGSPIEVDLSLDFQETKALTRENIETLNDQAYTNEGEKSDAVRRSYITRTP